MERWFSNKSTTSLWFVEYDDIDHDNFDDFDYTNNYENYVDDYNLLYDNLYDNTRNKSLNDSLVRTCFKFTHSQTLAFVWPVIYWYANLTYIRMITSRNVGENFELSVSFYQKNVEPHPQPNPCLQIYLTLSLDLPTVAFGFTYNRLWFTYYCLWFTYHPDFFISILFQIFGKNGMKIIKKITKWSP